MHGYDSADEVIGRHFSLTQVDKDQAGAEANVATLMDGKTPPNGIFSRRCKDGSVGWHFFSIWPIRTGERVDGLEGIIFDAAEHRAAIKENETLRSYNLV